MMAQDQSRLVCAALTTAIIIKIIRMKYFLEVTSRCQHHQTITQQQQQRHAGQQGPLAPQQLGEQQPEEQQQEEQPQQDQDLVLETLRIFPTTATSSHLRG